MWVSFDLGKYRPCDQTYCVYPSASVPPLDAAALDGTFRFLGAPGKPDARAEKRVAALEKKVRAVGLRLPSPFVTLMSRPRLYNRISSCTACEWDLGSEPIPNPLAKGTHTVRFLRDQQDVFLWYLLLTPKGGAEILCSRIPFDDPEVRKDRDIDADVVVGNSALVAPDFESFVYRYWMENELWELVQKPAPKLSPAQQAYLAHYEKAATEKKGSAKGKTKGKR